MKLLIIVGARPNFVKIAPLIKELKNYKKIKIVLVHTGQHYDFKMSQVFFQDLKIPKPNYNLNVGSGSHAFQVGKGMIKFEKIILKEKPSLIIVVGDANSCLIGALVAVKIHIPIAHIEAGLRSFDKRMPEEVNRLLVDHISDYLFTTQLTATKNLLKEGIEEKKIFFVGNIMIDSLCGVKNKIQKLKFCRTLKLDKKKYVLVTLHRQENVDNKKILGEIVLAIQNIQKRIKIIYPFHLRTEKQLKKFDFFEKIKKMKNITSIKPLSYLETLSLIADSKFVITDSGGIQEETTALGIPCLTLREVTERPVTVEVGTNKTIGTKRQTIIKESFEILEGKTKKGKIPKYWDGETSRRVVKILLNKLN